MSCIIRSTANSSTTNSLAICDGYAYTSYPSTVATHLCSLVDIADMHFNTTKYMKACSTLLESYNFTSGYMLAQNIDNVNATLLIGQPGYYLMDINQTGVNGVQINATYNNVSPTIIYNATTVLMSTSFLSQTMNATSTYTSFMITASMAPVSTAITIPVVAAVNATSTNATMTMSITSNITTQTVIYTPIVTMTAVSITSYFQSTLLVPTTAAQTIIYQSTYYVGKPEVTTITDTSTTTLMSSATSASSSLSTSNSLPVSSSAGSQTTSNSSWSQTSSPTSTTTSTQSTIVISSSSSTVTSSTLLPPTTSKISSPTISPTSTTASPVPTIIQLAPGSNSQVCVSISSTSGTAASLSLCSTSDNTQSITFLSAGNNTYQIKVAASSMCIGINIDSGDPGIGAAAQSWPCNKNYAGQLFLLSYINGSVSLASKSTGRCIGLSQGTATGSQLIQAACQPSGQSFRPIGSSFTSTLNKVLVRANNQVLTNTCIQSIPTAGVQAILQNCTSSDDGNQQLVIEPNYDNTYKLKIDNGYCLGINTDSGLPANGAAIQSWPCQEYSGQKWNLQMTGQGSCTRFVSNATGKCIGTYWPPSAGSGLVHWDCGYSQQVFCPLGQSYWPL